MATIKMKRDNLVTTVTEDKRAELERKGWHEVRPAAKRAARKTKAESTD